MRYKFAINIRIKFAQRHVKCNGINFILKFTYWF